MKCACPLSIKVENKKPALAMSLRTFSDSTSKCPDAVLESLTKGAAEWPTELALADTKMWPSAGRTWCEYVDVASKSALTYALVTPPPMRVAATSHDWYSICDASSSGQCEFNF